jgi:hypothetical protein
MKTRHWAASASWCDRCERELLGCSQEFAKRRPACITLLLTAAARRDHSNSAGEN